MSDNPEWHEGWRVDFDRLQAALPPEARLNAEMQQVYRTAWTCGYRRGVELAKETLDTELRRLGWIK